MTTVAPTLPDLLAANSAAFSRRMAAIPVVLRWLCEQLVRELLLGAWRFVTERTGVGQDRAFERFSALVGAAPCWPYYVEFMHPRDMHARAERGQRCWQPLLILTGAEADFLEEEAFE